MLKHENQACGPVALHTVTGLSMNKEDALLIEACLADVR